MRPHRSGRGLKCLRLYTITPTDTLTGRDGHSAADTRLHRLQALRELGSKATEAWLAEHPGHWVSAAAFRSKHGLPGGSRPAGSVMTHFVDADNTTIAMATMGTGDAVGDPPSPS